LDDLEKARKESAEELSRTVTLVQSRVVSGQEKRKSELGVLIEQTNSNSVSTSAGASASVSSSTRTNLSTISSTRERERGSASASGTSTTTPLSGKCFVIDSGSTSSSVRDDTDALAALTKSDCPQADAIPEGTPGSASAYTESELASEQKEVE
jgi:hypothetical protein